MQNPCWKCWPHTSTTTYKSCCCCSKLKEKRKTKTKRRKPKKKCKPKRPNRWVLGLLRFKNTQREDDGFTREDGGSLRRNQFGGGGQEEARCETSSSSSSSWPSAHGESKRRKDRGWYHDECPFWTIILSFHQWVDELVTSIGCPNPDRPPKNYSKKKRKKPKIHI